MVIEGRLAESIFSLTARKVGGRFYLWFPIALAQVLTRGGFDADKPDQIIHFIHWKAWFITWLTAVIRDFFNYRGRRRASSTFP